MTVRDNARVSFGMSVTTVGTRYYRSNSLVGLKVWCIPESYHVISSQSTETYNFMAVHFATRLSVFFLKLNVNGAVAVDIILETLAGCKFHHLNEKDSARFHQLVISRLFDDGAVESSLPFGLANVLYW